MSNEVFTKTMQGKKDTQNDLTLSNDLQNALKELSIEMDMTIEEMIAFGVGLIYEAKGVLGKICVIDERGKEVYRSEQIKPSKK